MIFVVGDRVTHWQCARCFNMVPLASLVYVAGMGQVCTRCRPKP